MKKILIMGLPLMLLLGFGHGVSAANIDMVTTSETSSSDTLAAGQTNESKASSKEEDKKEGSTFTDEETTNTTTTTEATETTETTIAETNESSTEVIEETEQNSTTSKNETTENESENTSDSLPILTEESPASDIRKFLTITTDYITQEELATYSDEQLATAWKVFFKYQRDLMGMDLSSYVRLLQAMYQNQTLSWKLMAPLVDFELSKFVRAKDIINVLPQFQAYLKAYYPSTSGFIQVRSLTDQELIDILNYLDYYEVTTLAAGGELIGGRMNYIFRLASEGIPADYQAETSTSEEETNQKQLENQKPATVTPVATNPVKNQEKLPQMNEASSLQTIFIGLIFLGISSGFFFKKYRNEN
ncbi:hypothetical protein ACYSNU_16835 [Enterococcus sp. LJL120]